MSCDFINQKHHFIEYEYGFYCQVCGNHLDKDKKRVIHNPYNFKKCGLCKKERKEEYTISKYRWSYFPVCKDCYFKNKK